MGDKRGQAHAASGLPADPQEAPQDGDVSTSTFSHSSRDMHVVVEKPEKGCMCTLSMTARVPLAPDRLYALLVSPGECMRIFRSLKRVRQRRVLEDDGKGNRTVEVDQTGAWRFLLLRGSFTVRMIVEQRAADRTIAFRLARPGFMRSFGGTWRIAPYDNASLDSLVNKHRPTAMHRLQAGLRAVEQSLGLAGPQEQSVVLLQQSIAPALMPPPALARVLQRIAAKQISKIMQDLQDEVARINAADRAGSSAASSPGSPQQQQQPQQAPGQRRKRGQQENQPPQQEPPAQQQSKKQLAAHMKPLQ